MAEEINKACQEKATLVLEYTRLFARHLEMRALLLSPENFETPAEYQNTLATAEALDEAANEVSLELEKHIASHGC